MYFPKEYYDDLKKELDRVPDLMAEILIRIDNPMSLKKMFFNIFFNAGGLYIGNIDCIKQLAMTHPKLTPVCKFDEISQKIVPIPHRPQQR